MEKNGWALTLQLFIAELKVVPEQGRIVLPSVSNPENEKEEKDWYASWGALLLATLYGNGRCADIETILFSLFPGWIKDYSPELIRKIVTGDSAAESTALLRIQNHALETGHIELALYVYNVLEIGELDERSKL